MFKLKNFAAVAVITLSATVAMASNFRAADQLYLPIGGHATGASGLFVSDLFVSNLSSDPVTVTMIYSSGDQGNQNTNLTPITLAANERKELVDFFGSVGISGLGQVVFNACKTGADCGPATQDASGVSPNFRNISIESRIYSVPNAAGALNTQATNGQDMPAYPWYSYVSMDQQANDLHRVFITGLRNTGSGVGTYRTNIGLVNASQYSATTLRVTVYNGAGAVQGTKDQALQPLGQVQFNISGITGVPSGTAATGLWAQIEQISATPTGDSPASCGTNGCPAFFAYASSLDNASGDATTLESQYFKSLDYALTAIYPGSGAGKSNQRRAVHH